MSSVRTTPRVGSRPSTGSSPKIACSTSPGASTVAATRSIASRARSRPLILTFDISQLPGPRSWAMAGGSDGYRAALVRRQLTPGLISSLPGTAGLPPFISFSTSYRHLCDEHQRRDGQHDAGCLRGVVYQRLKELGQHHRGREDDRTYQAARIPAPRSTTIVLAPNFADATLTVLQGFRGIFGDVLSLATPR